MTWFNDMAVGYLLIFLGSVLLCGMTVVRKEYQRRADATIISTITFMGVYSLSVCLIGVIYGFFTDFTLIRQIDGFVIVLSIFFSLILTINTCLCILGSKYGSLAIVSIFANLGTLMISTVYGLIFDSARNHLNGFKISGMVLVLAILALSVFEEKKNVSFGDAQKEKQHNRKFLAICILIFFFNGSALPIYSAFSTYRGEYGGFNFIFLYLFFCVLLCGVSLAFLLLLQKKKGTAVSEIKLCVSLKPLLCTLAYGLLFLFAEFTAIKTTVVLPIVVQAPLKFAVQVIIIAIADFLLFKQKITKIQFVQIGLAIVSGVLFAL